MSLWLCICCALVFAMVVLGGAVRLTGSGLSMVDWRPLAGVLPPMNDGDWMRLFDAYKRHAEYRFVNPDMTLAGFQFIFWMEYAHRLLGRVVGVVFAVPFAIFWRRGMLSRGMVLALCGLFLLGALQGVLGWWMVKSGLAGRPEVSHYRLLAHFMLAVVIYAGLVAVTPPLIKGVGGFSAEGRGIKSNEKTLCKSSVYLRGTVCGESKPPSPLYQGGVKSALYQGGVKSALYQGGVKSALYQGGVIVLVLLMMASGALVAGTDAGHIYNTWPKMGDVWWPRSLFALQPWWLNFAENAAAIQFVHRWLAAVVVLVVGGYAVRLIRGGRRVHGGVLLGLVVGQAGLGVGVLVWGVPVVLGVAHQAGAMGVLTGVVWGRWTSS